MRLGNNILRINSINVMKPIAIESSNVKINALKPKINSTIRKDDGRSLTYYYNPYEKEFEELVDANLKKNWTALFRKECKYSVHIRPLFSGNKNERIVYFGMGKARTVIKGWKGYFELEGEPEFLKFTYDTGLGSRNSQGFGMVQVIRN